MSGVYLCMATRQLCSFLLFCTGCSLNHGSSAAASPKTSPSTQDSSQHSRFSDEAPATASHDTTQPPSTELEAPVGGPDWAGSEPQENWWKELPLDMKSDQHGFGKLCHMELGQTAHDASLTPLLKRGLRLKRGELRVCFERARILDISLAGFWVGRVAAGTDRETDLSERIDSNLPEEFESCIEASLGALELEGFPGAKFEMLLRFRTACRNVPPGSH